MVPLVVGEEMENLLNAPGPIVIRDNKPNTIKGIKNEASMLSSEPEVKDNPRKAINNFRARAMKKATTGNGQKVPPSLRIK